MASRTEIGLTLTVEGASDTELMRGLRAAIALFDVAGITPLTAASAAFAREGWDVRGFAPETEPSDAESKAAELWDAAGEAAIAACCAGWPARPGDARLELERK
jgi:hypothetical protein